MELMKPMRSKGGIKPWSRRNGEAPWWPDNFRRLSTALATVSKACLSRLTMGKLWLSSRRGATAQFGMRSNFPVILLTEARMVSFRMEGR
jgi:hypothetical protein